MAISRRTDWLYVRDHNIQWVTQKFHHFAFMSFPWPKRPADWHNKWHSAG